MPAKKAPKRKRMPRKGATKKSTKQIQKVNVNVQSSGGGGGSGSALPVPTAFRDTAGEARQYENLLSVVKKAAENIKEDAARAMEGYRAQERLKRDEEMENRAMREFERPIFNAPMENTMPLAEAVAEAVSRKPRSDKGKERGSYKEKHMQEGLRVGYEGATAISKKKADNSWIKPETSESESDLKWA